MDFLVEIGVWVDFAWKLLIFGENGFWIGKIEFWIFGWNMVFSTVKTKYLQIMIMEVNIGEYFGSVLLR